MILPYTERVHIIQMSRDLEYAYKQLERCATEQLGQALRAGKTAALANWSQALLVYPEMPWLGWRERTGHGIQIGDPPSRPKQLLYPLDLALAEYAREQLWEGFPLIVYTQNTRRFDEQDHLATIFRRHSPLANGSSPSVAILRATIPAHSRSEWLAQQIRAGVHILICNPEVINEDLEVSYFKRIAFKRIPTSRATLYRSARCLLRPGQDTPVETTFFTYADTLAYRLLHRLAGVCLADGNSISMTHDQVPDGVDAEEESRAVSGIAHAMMEERGVAYAMATR